MLFYSDNDKVVEGCAVFLIGPVPMSLLWSLVAIVLFALLAIASNGAGQVNSPSQILSVISPWQLCGTTIFCRQCKFLMFFLHLVPKPLLVSALSLLPPSPSIFLAVRVLFPSDSGPQVSVKIFLVLGHFQITNGHFKFHY